MCKYLTTSLLSVIKFVLKLFEICCDTEHGRYSAESPSYVKHFVQSSEKLFIKAFHVLVRLMISIESTREYCYQRKQIQLKSSWTYIEISITEKTMTFDN